MTSIHNFQDFCTALKKSGFSMSGTNHDGFFSLSSYFEPEIQSHTDDPETDPWVWRIRAITEQKGIAYGKVFFKKGGWIIREWYPAFLAVRRNGLAFEDAYFDGQIPRMGKAVYELIQNNPDTALHDIKSILGLSKEESGQLESTLNLLQMKLFITISNQTRKLSQKGEPFGWPVTTFSTVEHFFGEEVFSDSLAIPKTTAFEQIAQQVFSLNPNAEEKKVGKFILG